MKIIAQSTAHIDKKNLEKLIKDTLYTQRYKVLTISFNIESKTKTVKGVTITAEHINFPGNSRPLINISNSVKIEISSEELLELAKEHLISEGYEVLSKPEFTFTLEDNSGDHFHHDSIEVFDGVKCSTGYETKTINLK